MREFFLKRFKGEKVITDHSLMENMKKNEEEIKQNPIESVEMSNLDEMKIIEDIEDIEDIEEYGDIVDDNQNTFAELFIESLEERWKEIDILMEQISAHEDEEIQNVLCRSTIILLVAHLEGFLKEAAEVLINDVNQFNNFVNLPKAIKKTHCSSFLSIDKSGKIDDRKLEKLILEFEKLNVKIDISAFLFENNKNPSPSIIEKIIYNFGVDDFFRIIHKSKFDIVFENSTTETEDLIQEIKIYLQENVNAYPYGINLEQFGLTKGEAKLKKGESLWKTFLDDLLQHRNKVAHGSIFSNELTLNDLKDYKTKVHVLQLIISLVMFDSGVKK